MNKLRCRYSFRAIKAQEKCTNTLDTQRNSRMSADVIESMSSAPRNRTPSSVAVHQRKILQVAVLLACERDPDPMGLRVHRNRKRALRYRYRAENGARFGACPDDYQPTAIRSKRLGAAETTIGGSTRNIRDGAAVAPGWLR